VTRSFRSMGCDVLVAGAHDDAFARIVALFDTRDAIFSRFRRDSELNAVNAAPGDVVRVSPEFLRAVRAALAAAHATDGLVEPTLGAAVEAAGYGADLHALPADGPLAPAPPRTDWRSLRAGESLLARRPGTVLDLNGVVKAMAVDDAAALLDGPGFVSAGGDVAVRGEPLLVGLPLGDVVTLEEGGIATSGTDTRTWRRGGAVQHHLIDPHTRRPSRSPWTAVTAVGRDCLAADVAAKAGFLLGVNGPAWLDEQGVAARFVAGTTTVCNGCWSRSIERTGAAA
jgi:thiamine biosynthesis lipoprotein